MAITIAEARRLGLLPTADRKPTRKDRWFPYKSQVEWVFARGHGKNPVGWLICRLEVGRSLMRGESISGVIDYEPDTFYIDGVEYTPDWRTKIYRVGDEIQETICYIETKGSEYQKNWRATIQLLRQASVLHPEHRWYLAEWSIVPGSRRREWRFWSVVDGRRKRIGGNSHVQSKARTRGEKML